MAEQRTLDRLLGAKIGQYHLERFVEENYFSPTYLAQAEGKPAQYLVRLLPEPTDLRERRREEYLTNFQYKAGQLAALQHPYLMPIVDYGIYRGIPYLVSPFISMRSLRTRLDKNGPMDTLTAGRYLDQICIALEYAHQQGVIHEGLSIDCISFKLDGQVLITQTGLMRLLEPYWENRQTSLRYLVGEGSAPEQLLGRPVGAFTDVYALGAVLYHMLTGSPVFSGSTLEEISHQHLYASIPPLSHWRGDFPSGLYNILARAMAKNPTQRFSQPGGLANAYHHIVDPNNRTRVPFVLGSAANVSHRDAPSLPGKVRITEFPNADFEVVKQAQVKQSVPQTPFPVYAPSFTDEVVVNSEPSVPAVSAAQSPSSSQKEERRIHLQRLLGKKSNRGRMQMIMIGTVALILLLLIGSIGVTLIAHQGAAATHLAGQVTFFDNQDRLPWTTDSLSMTLQRLKAPQSGYQYDAWLINNDSEQVIALGELTETNQQYSLHYLSAGTNGHAGSNLLSPGDKVEVTLEQGTPKQPVGNVVFSGTFPVKSFAHVTHLLVGFPDTPQQVGMLVGLLEQTRLLDIQTSYLQGLVKNQSADQTRCVAQSMLNIIEGMHGANYRPVGAECVPQLIVGGDGFGLAGNGFLAGTAEHATLAISQSDATPAMHQHAALMEVAITNMKSWVATLDQEALHLRNNPTDLSQVDEMTQLADTIYRGIDTNNNGQVDPVAGEAGALTAFQQGELMATLTLFPNV